MQSARACFSDAAPTGILIRSQSTTYGGKFEEGLHVASGAKVTARNSIASGGGVLLSRGNNTVEGNSTNTVDSIGSYGAK